MSDEIIEILLRELSISIYRDIMGTEDAAKAILSAIEARLPKEYGKWHTGDFLHGWDTCLSEVKKLLEIE